VKIKLSRSAEITLVIVLAIVVIVGLYWVNYQFSKTNPGGNDFLVHYIGTRSLIFDGISPYSNEVATRIQIAAYGHPAEGIEHELRVAYPLYSVFLFAPFSIIEEFNAARAAWMTVLELALIAMVFLSFDLVGWKPDIKFQAGILLFSLIWYHAIRGIINGNAVILIALMITAALSMIKKDHDAQAGILLAATTIKPHLVLLLLLFIIFWAIYKKRWKLIFWFLGSTAVLIGFGLILIPDWIYQNIWEVLRYPGYNPAGTLAAALAEWFPSLESQLKWIVAVPLGLLLCIEVWKARDGRFSHFLWASLLTLLISQWIGIQTDPGNFILLYPALILILSVLEGRWEERGSLIAGLLVLFLFLFPWLLFILTVQRDYQPVQSSVMFIPVPLFCFLGLFWIRWWVISPARAILSEDL